MESSRVARNGQSGMAVPFGRAMRKKHFLFDDGYINFNQGAFGAHPRPVQEALRLFQNEAEARPDEFIKYTYPERLCGVRGSLSKMLNVATDELVIVPNATTAFNTVLRNLRFEKGDKIVFFSTIYGAMRKTLAYLVESTPVEIVEVDHPLPISDDDLLQRFELALEKHGNSVKVAVFDTIVSMPGVRMPFERLTRLCHKYGVLSLIDAAHGIGHIPLDLGSFQPDFLVTNCHKWLWVPRVAAVFYVPFRNQHLIRSSLPTSHGFVPLDTSKTAASYNPMQASSDKNPFVAQFDYTGTIDTAPPLCILAALRFRDETCGGEKAIRDYRFSLAAKGEYEISKILDTKVLQVPSENRIGFANVWLPLSIAEPGSVTRDDRFPREEVPEINSFLNRKMLSDYNCYFAIISYETGWLARFSAEVYLDLDDFIRAGTILKALCERVKAFEYRSKDS